MQGPLKGLIAGVAAWKLGGGCLSTIIIFVLVYWLLGQASCWCDVDVTAHASGSSRR